ARILGGEPLLHPRLLDIIRIVRRSHLSQEIHVVTNGLLLDRAGEEFWQAVDRVQLSLYPDVSPKILEHPHAKLKINHVQRFSETFSLQRHEDAELVQKIWDQCGIRNYCYGIVDGRFYKCMRAPYLGKLLSLAEEDGLSLAAATAESL